MNETLKWFNSLSNKDKENVIIYLRIKAYTDFPTLNGTEVTPLFTALLVDLQ